MSLLSAARVAKELFVGTVNKSCVRLMQSGQEIRPPGDRHFEEIDCEIYRELIANEEDYHKVDTILQEYEYEKYTTLRVPSTLTIDNMQELMAIDDRYERMKLINFLHTKQIAKSKSMHKKKEHSKKYWEESEQKWNALNAERTGIWDNEGNLVYGLWHNSMLSKIYRKSLNNLYTHRLRNAALFGPKLVIDLSYEKYMKLYENRLLLQQLNLVHSYNKYKTTLPFDLHFTSCLSDSVFMREIRRFFANYESHNFMTTLHSESVFDVFPKQDIVYLSPHANRTLKAVEDDKVFVIGGMIDKSFHQPITYVTAKKAGVEPFRLPIDENILWKMGTKSLCLNHVVAILHDFRVNKLEAHDSTALESAWRHALQKNIPQRKQKKVEEVELEDMLRKKKIDRNVRIKSNKDSFER